MTNLEYNKILNRFRRKELRLTREKLLNVVSLLDEVSESLETQIARFADENGKLRREQLQAMKGRIESDLEAFKAQYDVIVQTGVSDSAAVILERNGEIFVQVEGTKKLIDILQDKIILQAVSLPEKDGLILSDRIWRITEEAKADITARVQQGMLLGESHTKVARDIRQYVKGGGLKYKSERLVITEMSKAYKRANEASVEVMRQNSDFMWFEKWELSSRHPRPDVCGRAGTLIETKEGPKKIEDIKIGDEVLTHKGRYKKVTQLYRNQVRNAELQKLTFQSEKNRTHEVIVTPNHPFLIDEKWIPAGELKKGCSGVALPESLCEQENQFVYDKSDKEE
ncbi:MAG: Hint domain-containing protein [Syntrophobacteraceae bacterium]